MKKEPNLIPIKNFPRKLRDPVKALEYLKNDPPESWERRGRQMALKLFHEMSQRVPAYKDFLKKHKINPSSIKTIKDFEQLPVIDKDNYLRKYPLPKLCWDGELDKKWTVFSATSGSTGTPFYFPRDDYEDWEYSMVAELYLLNHYDIDKKSTLYINAFAMGAWIGGLFTYQAIKNVSDRGNYQIGMVNPGINKEEILKSIKNLSSYYDQIIIGGYPPFVKDLVDYGQENNFSWKSINTRFIFSAEGFSEEFRDYILKKAGCENPYTDSLNHYGTVDMGTMSHETPLSILCRREAVKNKKLFKELFNQRERLPTFTQYIPELFYFENDHQNKIFCTSRSGIPLVRYDLKDIGGVKKYSEIYDVFKKNNIDLSVLSKSKNISSTEIKLPFVYLYEREDFSVSWFGANIYPEHIKRALRHKNISNKITGKFTMQMISDKKHNPELEINIELAINQKSNKNLINTIQKNIVNFLLENNTEYKSSSSEKPKGLIPKVRLWPYESQKYFASKGKQKWVIK